MKTILCQPYQKEFIYHSLLKEQNFVTDVQFKTISGLLKVRKHEEKAAAPLQLAHLLKNKSDDFPIYRAMFRYPAFIDEILRFARECALFNISADALPSRTPSEAELKRIIKTALSMDLEEKQIYENYNNSIKAAARVPMECEQPFETNMFHLSFLFDLNKCGNLTFRETGTVTNQLRFQYALNTRQEIESIAQEIARTRKSCTVVLTSYNEQFPVLNQVFNRYRIPFNMIQAPVHTNVTHIYCALAALAMNKDKESMLAALSNDAFAIPFPDDVILFLAQLLSSAMLDDYSGYDLSLFDQDQQWINEKYQKAVECYAQIQDDLNLLLDAQTVYDQLTAAFTVLQHSPYLSDAAELKCALEIRTILSQNLKLIESREDAAFILESILATTVRSSVTSSDFCNVTDLTHPVPYSQVTYVVGCSGRNYPGIPIRKGLFDEAYCAEVPAYPSLKRRHNMYLHQLKWIRSSAEEVVYSYAANDYQGREIQLAFEIEMLMTPENRARPWQLDQLRAKQSRSHELLPETAKALFTRQGTINSSISRIERYFNCPYSYFIESGLKVRIPQRADMDVASVGTIQHALMENQVNLKGDQYHQITEEELTAFLDPYFKQLKLLHPDRIELIDLSQKRMVCGFLNSFAFLHRAEVNTLFKPYKAELEFNDFHISKHIRLKGVIDRVDTFNHEFRIIDYKSSEHKLSASVIKTGTLLQLISYVLAAAEILKKEPQGAYYFSLQQKKGTIEAGKYTARTGLEMVDEITEELCEEANDKTRSFCGWAFAQSDMDKDVFKRFYTPHSDIYDIEELSDYFEELYELFYKQAVSGVIPVKPIKGACTFCNYKAICRNRAGEEEKKPVIENDTKFIKRKEKEN